MSLTVTDTELIQRAIASRLGDVYTALPGRVESYDPATQTADVAPTVQRPIPTTDGGTSLEDLPVLPNVPVCFPRAGAFSITWPLAKGDHVLLIVMTYAIGQWRKSGETSAPGDLRTHHLGSAVAIPTLAPNAQALPEAQAGANAMVMSGPLIVLGAADATDFAALASKCDANFDAIKNMFTSWVVAPNDGGAALKTLSGSLSFEPVACERVKVK